MEDIIFEELEDKEKILLLRAFDFDVDSEGFILSCSGERIPSKEFPNEFLNIRNSMLTPGSLSIEDGTPEAISKFIRETLEDSNVRN